MDKYIITLGREFGSGGREIAAKLSENLGIKYYDKEIIEIAAEDSGYVKELFENHDEKRDITFGGSDMASHGIPFTSFYYLGDTLNADTLFRHKMDTIKKLAEKGSCIFVGRCADYVLRDEKNLIKVFITCNDMEKRKQRVLSHHPEITEKQVENYIKRTDRKRADYYSFYTDNEWGSAKNYDIIVDTAAFGIDGAADVIVAAVKEKLAQNND